MNLRAAAHLALCCLLGLGAADAPTLLPTRDVSITYRHELDGRAFEQQFHWSAAAQRVRLDAPGNFFIFDYRTRRGDWARETDRSYLEVERPDGMPGQPPPERAAVYLRSGTDRIAGIGCTEWTLRGSSPETRICVSDDGVLLRMQINGRTTMIATEVRFTPQDPSLFRVPDGYTRLTGPK